MAVVEMFMTQSFCQQLEIGANHFFFEGFRDKQWSPIIVPERPVILTTASKEQCPS
jgi:hypothetical protein